MEWLLPMWDSLSASMFNLYSMSMLIGGITASFSMAWMFVVWNAPVIIWRQLFCSLLSRLFTTPLFPFQTTGMAYNVIGRMAPMYTHWRWDW